MELAAEPLVHPAFGKHPGDRIVEMKHEHGVGSGAREQFLPLVERGQPERGGVGPEMADRMRIEGRDNRRAAFSLRPLHGFADDRLMAAMESIEIAQRENRAVHGGRERFSMIDANHDSIAL